MNALLRIAAWILALALVLAPGVAVLQGWLAGSRFPMRQLVVTGEFHQVSDTAVRAAVLPFVGEGFFAVDPASIRDQLAKMDWVRSVEVRKRWPDRLEVALVEYKPLARWGKDRMLSENGEIFPAPRKHSAALPMFIGPDDRAAELMAFHSQARPLFLGLGLQVAQVELSARGSWRLRLSDGSDIEVGRGDPQARLARFVRMLPRLQASEPRQLARADLRYTNGFAITWVAADAAPTPARGNT